jgi:hypothetical protein
MSKGGSEKIVTGEERHLREASKVRSEGRSRVQGGRMLHITWVPPATRHNAHHDIVIHSEDQSRRIQDPRALVQHPQNHHLLWTSFFFGLSHHFLKVESYNGLCEGFGQDSMRAEHLPFSSVGSQPGRPVPNKGPHVNIIITL